MAIPRNRVFKDKDGYWTSRIHFVDGYLGVQCRVFKSRVFDRAIKHAVINT